MSWLHFVALLLFFLTEPTRSLPPSAIREFGGVNSKVDQFALPISLNRTISNLDAISEACSKSLFDLKLSVISQCKCIIYVSVFQCVQCPIVLSLWAPV